MTSRPRPARRAVRPAAVAGTFLIVVLAACSGGAAPPSTAPASTSAGATSGATSPPEGSDEGGALTVFAAASLTDVFDELGAMFESEHPGVEITFSYGASSELATQIVEGAPADVFAAASTTTMEAVTSAGLASGAPQLFATNVLQIAVPPENPGAVTSLADLSDPNLLVALCAPEVPCGAAARRLLEVAGVTVEPDTLEEDVRSALTKVQLGEVDAALVYRTDVIVAGDSVEGIEIPEAGQVVNSYPVVALSDAADANLAAAFVEFLRSPEAAGVLVRAGFGVPELG